LSGECQRGDGVPASVERGERNVSLVNIVVVQALGLTASELLKRSGL
jgi:hypothetical protein